MDKNRRLAEALGIEWHEPIKDEDLYSCSCGNDHWKGGGKLWVEKYHCDKENPDFTADQSKVLVEMRKREDWPEFHMTLFKHTAHGWSYDLIPVDLILDRTGKLAEMAIEWMEGMGK